MLLYFCLVVPANGLHFELRGERFPNNSAVPLRQVGEGNNAVFCKTNKTDCCGLPKRAGEFYYPNGDQVSRQSSGDRFYRNRSNQMIRLNRRSGTESPLGKYRCEIPDADGNMQTMYIELN